MSPSSRESNLSQLRERLAQLNTEFFMVIADRRGVSMALQDLKEPKGRYSHFDPERESALFKLMSPELKTLSLKELLAFSLVMEDQAMAMAPGSYPNWSGGGHLTEGHKEIFEMINPLLLKTSRPEMFSRLKLSPEFTFLKDF